MASIKKLSQFSRAEAVLALMQVMIDEDGEEDLYVGPGTAGLHIQSRMGDRRCNIFGHGNSDALMLVIGERVDFNYETRESKDTARRFAYAHDKYHEVASAALAWLQRGFEPATGFQ